MTKRKNVVSKMLLLVLILTLISCCFLGSTFARYTSSGEGKGTLQVAKWDVSHGEGNIDVTFAKLSPSKEVFGSVARENKTGKELVATITYDVDVETILTFTTGDVVLQGNLTYGEGMETDGIPTGDEVKEVFSIALYVNETEDKADTAIAYSEMTLEADTNGTIYIYAEVTWTSDNMDNITGDLADKRDTWIGGNITGVEYAISYKAVQNTQIPEAQA